MQNLYIRLQLLEDILKAKSYIHSVRFYCRNGFGQLIAEYTDFITKSSYWHPLCHGLDVWKLLAILAVTDLYARIYILK